MRVATGSYTGNATDGRTITVGFPPKVVFLKRLDASSVGMVRTDSMAGDLTCQFTSALAANLIQSLTSDGFTVGDSTSVNGSGGSYGWCALGDDGGGDLVTGSYVGNGNGTRSITGLGIAPDAVFVFPADANNSYWRTDTMTGAVNVTGSGFTAHISSLDADGFSLGFSVLNGNGVNQHYIGLVRGESVDTFSYTGDGLDNRSITVPLAFAALVMVGRDSFVQGRARLGAETGDESFLWGGTVGADGIQSMGGAGTSIQVGTAVSVNANGVSFEGLVLASGLTMRGVQAAPSGVVHALQYKSLAGNQPASTGTAAVTLRLPRRRLPIAAGTARVTSVRPASGSIRTRRDGVL